jgi:hypothetical protein
VARARLLPSTDLGIDLHARGLGVAPLRNEDVDPVRRIRQRTRLAAPQPLGIGIAVRGSIAAGAIIALLRCRCRRV